MLQSQEGDSVHSSRSIPPADSFKPATETTSDCSQENMPSVDTSGDAELNIMEPVVTPSVDTSGDIDLNIMEPVVTVTRLKMQEEKQPETDTASQDLGIAATSSPDEDFGVHLEDRAIPSQLSADEEVDSGLAAAEEGEESNGEEEPPASQGKKNSTGKAKTTPKRRSGRSTASRR